MGRIFDIQRFSVHDGPGIRTTVFLKGCPLRCVWCHNPEGINAGPMVSFLPEKCLACGECVRACMHDAHRLDGSDVIGHPVVHGYNRDACETCGTCTRYCDSGALEFVGRPMSVEDVMKEVSQDKPFYASSGGGMTISGGEPLAQIDFTIAVLRAAKELGIDRCLDFGLCQLGAVPAAIALGGDIPLRLQGNRSATPQSFYRTIQSAHSREPVAAARGWRASATTVPDHSWLQ